MMRVAHPVTFKVQKNTSVIVNSLSFNSTMTSSVIQFEPYTPNCNFIFKLYVIDDVISRPSFTGNGKVSGGTYMETVDNVYKENVITLYYRDIRLAQKTTVNGKFEFNFLNTAIQYDIKATPLDITYNPKIRANVQPVVDNSSFRFLFYCYHDKIYTKSKTHNIQTVAFDTLGILQYNIDNPPTNVSINANTGLVSFNISIIGTYTFTVNCIDPILELTKSTIISFKIV